MKPILLALLLLSATAFGQSSFVPSSSGGGSGTVTSVGTQNVSVGGLTLTGTVTTSGNLVLGGTVADPRLVGSGTLTIGTSGTAAVALTGTGNVTVNQTSPGVWNLNASGGGGGVTSLSSTDGLITYTGSSGAISSSLTTGTLGPIVSTLRHWYSGSNGTRIRTGISGSNPTIAICGDSTSLILNGAVAIYSQLATEQKPGGLLEGVTVTAFGTNGQSADGALTDSGATGFLTCVASKPDVMVLDFGINNCRTGQSTATVLPLLKALVSYANTNNPGGDIILRMPQPFTTDNVGGANYITGGTAATDSANLRAAYLALQNVWPNVVVMDSAPTYGTVCLSSSATYPYPFANLIANQIHPSGAGYQADAGRILALVGQQWRPYDQIAVNATRPGSPPSIYHDYWTDSQAVLDQAYYTPIFSAPINAQDLTNGTIIGNYNDGAWTGAQRLLLQTGGLYGDLALIPGQPPFIVTQVAGYGTNNSQFRLKNFANISSIVSSTSTVLTTSGTVATAQVTCTATHYLTNQEQVVITSNSNSTPVISGTYPAYVLATDSNAFLIPLASSTSTLTGTGVGGYIQPALFTQANTGTNNTVAVSYGNVTFYRPNYCQDSTVQQYWQQDAVYPYKWKGYFDPAQTGGTNGNLFIASLPGELSAANRSAVAVGDIVVVQAATTGTLGTAAYNVTTVLGGIGGDLNVHVSGSNGIANTTSFPGLPVAVFGNHPYENGSIRRQTSYQFPAIQAGDSNWAIGTGLALVSNTLSSTVTAGPSTIIASAPLTGGTITSGTATLGLSIGNGLQQTGGGVLQLGGTLTSTFTISGSSSLSNPMILVQELGSASGLDVFDVKFGSHYLLQTSDGFGNYNTNFIDGAYVFGVNYASVGKPVISFGSYFGINTTSTSTPDVKFVELGSGTNGVFGVQDKNSLPSSLGLGHLFGTSATPTITVNANAGTGGSAIISNASDFSGTISVTAGVTPNAGAIVTGTFAKPFVQAPNIVVGCLNANAFASGPYGSTTSTTFTISVATALVTGSYNYTYLVTGTSP